ncbi:MAG: methyltransferase domain-containing protein [Verrucomicrobiota bacterium]|nr:methyltransferase domain-containing protein [Verrucomicrobiota bacterium]
MKDYIFCKEILQSIFVDDVLVQRTLARFTTIKNNEIMEVHSRIQGLMRRCGNINAVKEFLTYLVFETQQEEKNDYSYQMARLRFIEKMYDSPAFMAMKQSEKNKIIKLMKWQVERVVRMSNLICSKIENLTEKTVLDIGCGIGQFSYQLAKQGMKVRGIDLNVAESVKIQKILSAEHPFVENVTFIQGNALDMSSIQEQYDIITLADVVEHIVDKKQLFNEVNARLKPGGSLVIHTDNLTKLQILLMVKRILYFLTLKNPKSYNLAWSGGDGDHIGLQTPKYLMNMLKGFGFTSMCKYDKDSFLAKINSRFFANGFLLLAMKEK